MTNFKNNMMLTSLKLSKLFGLISILIIGMGVLLILAGCKGGGGATKPDGKPNRKAIRINMDNPTQMYCIRNNTKIRDFNRTYRDWKKDLKTVRTFTNYAILDQIMKYDRLTMYEVRSNWAYIQTAEGIKGWTPRRFLREWNTDDFFNVKDNIFKVGKTKDIYNHPFEGKIIGKFKKGDTIRVLKGNGERFFVVSKSGKSGWINASDINTKKLIAKNLSYKKMTGYRIPKSEKYMVGYYESSMKPVSYRINEGDFFDKNFLNGDYSKVFKSGSSIPKPVSEGGEVEIVIFQNDKETNLIEILGLKGRNHSYYNKRLFLNFFGMIAYISFTKPESYGDTVKKFKKQYFFSGGKGQWKSDGYSEEDYMELIKFLSKQEKFEETIKIELFSRDVNVRKIKDVYLTGTFAFEETLRKFLDKPINKVLVENGDIVVEWGVLHNGVFIDNINFGFINNLPILIPPNGYYSDGVSVYTFDNKPPYKNIDSDVMKNLMKPKIVKFRLTKEELAQAGLNAEKIKEDWDNYIRYHNFSGVKIDFSKWEKKAEHIRDTKLNVLEVNGEKFYLNKDYTMSTGDMRYIPENNIFVFPYYSKKARAKKILGGGGGVLNYRGEIVGNINSLYVNEYIGNINGNIILESVEVKNISGVQYEY